MVRTGDEERRFSAIRRIRSCDQVEQRAGRLVAAELERDRRPKLSPRIPTGTLQIGISGLYFIRSRRRPVRKAAEPLRLFPCSRLPKRWKQAREQRKCMIML